MRLSEIFNNLNIKFNNDIEITGISIDSRNIKKVIYLLRLMDLIWMDINL